MQNKYKDAKNKRITFSNKIFIVPSIFSIIKNPESSIKFFDSIRAFIKINKKNTKIFFDMSNIKIITVDALLYLLALIKNLGNFGKIRYLFSGNLPVDNNAKCLVEESEFLSHMESSNNDTIYNTDKIAIRSGNDGDTSLIGEICKFIHKTSKLTILDY